MNLNLAMGFVGCIPCTMVRGAHPTVRFMGLNSGEKMAAAVSPRTRQLAPFALVLAGALVAIAAYLQALNYPFIIDDVAYVADNPELAGLPLTELWRLFTRPYNVMSEYHDQIG